MYIDFYSHKNSDKYNILFIIMEKQDIINEIIKSNIVEKVTNSMLNVLKSDKDDFIQEMYLILLEMPQDKLQELYNNGALYFYIVRILKNQGIYLKSPFNKKIKETNIKKIYIDSLTTNEQEICIDQ